METKQKQRYQVKNWSAYNQALVNRGSLTLWFEESQLERWRQPERTGYQGSPMLYSDWAIQCALTIREIFHCPLRVTEGFLKSLVKLLSLPLKVPNDSTLSRRQHTLMVKLPRASNRTPRYRVVDSTGLKVYGEGEWQVRQPGLSQRRTRRKLHRVGDANIQSIVAVELTANFIGDPEVLPDMLKQLPGNEAIATLAGDGAYDTANCHQAITARQAQALIPPRAGAVEWPDHEDGSTHPRTAIVRACSEQGESEWKRISGYHRRSWVETAMFRIKRLFSDKLKNRTFAAQQTEAYLRVGALNKMTGLGMPESYPVT